MVIEEGLHLHGVVQLIRVLPRVMRLSPVLKEDGVFPGSAEGKVELDALVPGYRFVLVSMHEDQGRLHSVRIEERGVLDVVGPSLPQAT